MQTYTVSRQKIAPHLKLQHKTKKVKLVKKFITHNVVSLKPVTKLV